MLRFIVSIFITSVFIINGQSFKDLDKNESDFNQIRRVLENELIGNGNLDTLKGWKQFKRWEWFWETRLHGQMNFPNVSEIYNTMNRYYNDTRIKDNFTQSVEFEPVGPFSLPKASGRSQGMGRINDIEINPDNENIIYIGTASGGVWKTVNGGSNWKYLEMTGQLSTAISDIELSHSNTNIIYVATGDANGTLGTGGDYYSTGILKSTDAGNSWKLTNLIYSLDDRKSVTRLKVDPENPDILLASTTIGIQKSTDGGDSWETVYSGDQIKDMEFHPTNKDIIYASTQNNSGTTKIFKTVDFGSNWTEINKISGSIRTELAVSPDAPDFIFAVSAASHRGLHSVIYSTNAGDTWKTIATQAINNNKGNLLGWSDGRDLNRGQGHYDLAIEVNPENAAEIYVGGVNIWKTDNLGDDWELVTHWYGGFGQPEVHADHHQFMFNKSGSMFYSANDGGLYRSGNDFNWDDLNDGLNITQFYKLGVSQQTPGRVIGGSQDNGTSLRTGNGDEWIKAYTGDGMECAINPIDDDLVFASGYNGNLQRSTNGGKSFSPMLNPNIISDFYDETELGAWVTPFVISKSNPKNIYAGFNNVWKNTDNGLQHKWEKISDFNLAPGNTLRTVAISPNNDNYIYAATLSQLFRTTNGGKSWESILNSSNAITSVEVNPNNPEQFFLTKSGYRPNDKVYFYDGNDFINISGNLPNVPSNSIVLENTNNFSVYLGTDIGVFYSDFNSGMWTKLEGSFPNTIVSELEIQEQEEKIYFSSYGRGIWKFDLFNCQNEKVELNINNDIKICEGDSVILEPINDYEDYLWNNGSKDKSITVKESGTYILTIPGSEFCSSKSNVIRVEVIDKPNLVINKSGSTDLCEGDTLLLAAPFGINSFEWSTGDTSRVIEITEEGSYFLTATNENNCESVSQTIHVTILESPEKPKIIQNRKELFIDGDYAHIQWYLNGNELGGENGNKIDINSLGKYSVKVTSENGCTVESDLIDIITSIEELNSYVSVYPNPNKGQFKVHLVNINNTNNFSLRLFNSEGQLVYKKDNYTNDIIEVDISNFAKGVYILKLRLHDQIVTKKIINR